MRRSSASKNLLALLLATAILTVGTGAHEDLEIRIAELTERFAQTNDVGLLIRRADLHRRHRDWRNASADLERATELGAAENKVGLARAMLLLDNEKPALAIEALAGLDDVPARFTRARALAQLGKTAEASEAFTRAVAACKSPLPEQFIEHARLLAGAEPPRLDQALGVIARGLEVLGPIISLHEEGFRLERKTDPAAALQRARDINRSDRRPNPRWLLREIELLIELEKTEQAAASIAATEARLDALPARRQQTPAIREIRARLKSLQLPSQPLSSGAIDD